jgi:hypothetical protein
MEDAFERLVHRLGYLAARAGDMAREVTAHAGDLEEDVEERLGSLDAEDITRVGAWGAGAVGSLVMARLLRPRSIDWQRAALAGVLATVAYDAVAWIDERLGARESGSEMPERSGREQLTRLVARYGAGVGLAMVYAKFIHGRIPGPRVLGGVAFGVADGAAGAAGGLLPLAHRLSPSVPLPFEARGLTPAAQVTLRTLVRHAVFGATLGAVYDDE